MNKRTRKLDEKKLREIQMKQGNKGPGADPDLPQEIPCPDRRIRSGQDLRGGRPCMAFAKGGCPGPFKE